MALAATTVWEVRTTGHADNGGGFNPSRDAVNGVDYSQQDAAQFAPTDLAMTAASTTLTSATGGFTHAMEGNLIKIVSGTNFVVGWYEIVTYTNTNTVTLDRTAVSGGNGSDGHGHVGGGIIGFTDALMDAMVDKNTMYVKDGSYTLTESLSAAANTNGCSVIGYGTTRGDNPTGTSRPDVTCGDYLFGLNKFWRVFNMVFTGTGTSVLSFNGQGYTQARNCKVTNTSATANRVALADCTVAVDCELASTNGYAINTSNSLLYGCYLHDSVRLVNMSDGLTCVNCNLDTGSGAGIYAGSYVRMWLINNTIYGCGNGVQSGGKAGHVMLNNLLDTNTTGVNYSVSGVIEECMLHDFDNFNGNTTARAGLTAQPNDTTADPGFTDAAGGNFQTGANVDDTGFGIRLGVG